MQRRKNLSTDQNKNKIKGEETSASIKTRIKLKKKILQHRSKQESNQSRRNLSTNQNKNKIKDEETSAPIKALARMKLKKRMIV